MKGIIIKIPYHQLYSGVPTAHSKSRIGAAIESARKMESEIDMGILIVIIKSPDQPVIRNVVTNIFSTMNRESVNPHGMFVDWKQSPLNEIEIHSSKNMFQAIERTEDHGNSAKRQRPLVNR
jgi:hypothetical protein